MHALATTGPIDEATFGARIGLARSASALLASALLFMATGAHAVTLVVTGVSGADQAAMTVGETITIDVRVVADGDQVYGLGASIYGYDESVVDYVGGSGQAVASIFHAFAAPPATVFDGLENAVPNPLVESAIGSNGSRVWLCTCTALTARSDQPLDPGLDGLVGNGDAQFRVTFEALAPGSTQIEIGTGYEGDGVVLALGQTAQAVSAFVDVVVLDPGGPTVPSIPMIVLYSVLPALLVLTGLIGLRARGR